MKEAMYELKEKDTESSSLIDAVTEKLMILKTDKNKEDGSLDKPMKEFISKLEERWRNGGEGSARRLARGKKHYYIINKEKLIKKA